MSIQGHNTLSVFSHEFSVAGDGVYIIPDKIYIEQFHSTAKFWLEILTYSMSSTARLHQPKLDLVVDKNKQSISGQRKWPPSNKTEMMMMPEYI
jgi:hypothetical protein